MFELTQDAREELDSFFSDKEKNPVRIFLASGGCSGPRLALALDSPDQDADKVFDEQGYTFCINNELFAQTGAVKVDMTPMGFTVASANALEFEGESGCSGCAGSCGHH